MIFDSHAHYDDGAFDEDRETLLDTMEARGIGYIVNVGSDMKGCKYTLGMVKRFPLVYGALGFHPNEVNKLTEEDYKWLEDNINTPKIVAVGEIGLDYFWSKNEPEKKVQRKWFERQIELAKSSGLPVNVHSRDAAEDTLNIIKEVGLGPEGGIIHCFSYGAELVKEYLKLGMYIGVGGVVTFKNGRKIKEVVEHVPLESIVIETDCPYLSPEPVRGQRNSSLNLNYVVNEIAAIKNVTPHEVIKATMDNAKKVYQINQ